MGVTSFDNLPQNIVTTRVRDGKQELMEQKGSLQVLSGNNMVFHSYMNTVTFTKASSISTPATVEVNFTSTQALTPLADLAAFVELSNDGVTWTPFPDFTDLGQPSYNVFDVHGGNLTPYLSKYIIVISTVSPGQQVRVTVQVLANDRGSI